MTWQAVTWLAILTLLLLLDALIGVATITRQDHDHGRIDRLERALSAAPRPTGAHRQRGENRE